VGDRGLLASDLKLESSNPASSAEKGEKKVQVYTLTMYNSDNKLYFAEKLNFGYVFGPNIFHSLSQKIQPKWPDLK
jgi:hypothetical protein